MKIATAILELVTDSGKFSGGLADAGKSTKAFALEVSGLGSALGVLAGGLGAAAIGATVKQFVDYAGQIEDLSSRLSIPEETVQEWQAFFGQAGVDVESVAKASEQLSLKLIGGDKSAVGALQKMGLSIKELKEMSPEERFNKVADAIGNLQDAGERAYAAKTLLGKAGPEMLAALDGHLAESIDKMREMGLVIDGETIKAADDFGDQLGFLGKQLLGIVATVVGPLIPALSALGNVISWLGREVIGPVLGGAVRVAMTMLSGFVEAVTGVLSRLAGLGAHILGVGGKFQQMADALSDVSAKSGQYMQNLWKQTDATTGAGDAAKKARPHVIGLGDDSDEASKKAKKLADELLKFNQTVADVIAWAKGYESVLDTIDGSVMEGVKYYRARDVAMDKLQQMYGLSAIQVQALNEAEKAEAETLRASLSADEAAAAAMAKLLKIRRESVSVLDEPRLLPGIDVPKLISQNMAKGSGLGKLLGEDVKDFFANGEFGKLIVGGLTGGGGLKGGLEGAASALGSTLTSKLGSSISKTLGGTLGSTLGSLVGPLGALAGPLLDKAIGKIKSLFQSSESKINPIRQQFVDAAGGLDALNKKAHEAGVTLDALLGAKNQSQYDSAVKTLQAAFDRVDSVSTGFDALSTAVQGAGGRVPESLRPMLEGLIQMDQLTSEQRDKLTALLAGGAADMGDIEQRAQELGVTVEQLGPKFQQQDLLRDAGKLGQFFLDAKDAGADLGGTIGGLKEKAQGFVTEALKGNLALPASLKEVAEYYYNTGQLLDENGDKLTDFSRLSFVDTPLDKSSQAIVDAINSLKELFEKMPSIAQTSARGITDALNSIPSNKRITITESVEGGLIDASARVPVIPEANGGFGRVTGPTLFYSAGNEDFAFSGEGRAFSGGGTANLLDAVHGEIADLNSYFKRGFRQDMALAMRDQRQLVSVMG